METECNGMLPFLGIQLLNRSPQIETKVYVKPTNSGLLLHYQSHVDNRYKKGLLRTMLDQAHRLSSSWTHFSDECDRLKTVFSRLKYPKHLVNSTIRSFVDSKVCDQQQPLSPSQETDDTIRVVLPFKDQISADIVKKELKDQSLKVSRKIEQELNVKETKPPIVNQQCVVYGFQCDLCEAGYVGCTRGHLHNRVKGHNAFYKSFKAKSQRAIRLNSCESIFIIFAPSYVNSSRQNRFKCCNLHDLIHIFLDNGVLTTPKRRILSFVFTVLCFKKSLLIRNHLLISGNSQKNSEYLENSLSADFDHLEQNCQNSRSGRIQALGSVTSIRHFGKLLL